MSDIVSGAANRFIAYLRFFMKVRGMKREELAEYFGIAPKSLNKMFQKGCSVTLDKVMIMFDVFAVEPNVSLLGENADEIIMAKKLEVLGKAIEGKKMLSARMISDHLSKLSAENASAEALEIIKECIVFIEPYRKAG